MGFIWFWIVAVMLAAYVVMDGFDLGVGILHPLLARGEPDRRLMLRSIGPVWDGNEVWLLAGGGTLYFAFPRLYASAFSGFYLALMIVLWLLIMRGASVELRTHIDNRVWRSFFDGLFFASSSLLAVFYGAALANVIRGVPLRADGYFFLPLWTNFRVGPEPGILDWYTVIGGVLALVALAIHGALYLAVKTEADLQKAARAFVRRFWGILLALTAVSLLASIKARPDALTNYRAHPVLFAIPLPVLLAVGGIVRFCRTEQDRKAFVSSCAYLATMMVGTAVAMYPRLLPSSFDPRRDLTVQNALSGPHTLEVGLWWWAFGMILVILYFTVVYHMFRGKVTLDSDGYGH
ncbi:MAG TPA: cytochrome d ubiquinol oxidase subunit II [Terriglobales bacterium]|nr:cytochrome d ubiquinol oxidase subunit II [Terriglobales bacterium]